MSPPREQARTVAGLVCAAAAAWLAVATYLDVSMAGFPDGHVTDYAAAVDAPLRIATWMAVAFAVLFVVLALSPMRTRIRTIAFFGAIFAFAVVVIIAQFGIPWYFGTHLGLDNGIGG